jgi:regulator of chromosome condensation
MAPRAGSKRRTSDLQDKPVKKQASTNNITTKAKEAAATKRASQPLAPSTSQNSVVKATAKHKGRKPSQSIPKEEIVVAKTRKIPAPSKTARTTVTDAGTKLNVYAFGSGSMGELGLGPQSNQRNVKRPRLNPNLLPDEVGIVDIAAGGMHCAAIDNKGRVWTWGVNDQGVLGRDTTWSPENEDEDMDDDDDEKLNPLESVPGLVEGLPEGTVVSKIACGDSITVALTNDGKVYAWGTFRACPSYLCD